MNYSIRWKDMSSHPTLEEFFREKIQKIFEFSFVEENIKAEYIYYKRESEYKLRINIKIHRGEIIRAEASDKNPEKATLKTIDKLIDQLRKIKTKLNSSK